MKKLLALLLVIVMIFAFAACGTPDENEVRGEQTTNSTGGEAEENNEFSFGETEGLKYENKFIGIGCKLDGDWTFYTDEQIKELNNLTADLFGDELQAAIEKATIIYDMYASNTTTFDTISVNLEKADPAQIAKTDLKKNYEVIYPTLKQSFENIGGTNITKSIVDMKIGNKAIPCMKISLEVSGIKMYEIVFQVKCNGYMANIAIATVNEDRCAEILAKFYNL